MKLRKSVYTSWQLWAQEYQSKIPTFLRRETEEIDKYSFAAWQECKRRALEIIEKNGSYGMEEVYKKISKL